MSDDNHNYTAQMSRSAYDLWLEALESGRYQQTTGHLQDAQGHCCLGVLCEVALAAGVKLRVQRFDDPSLAFPQATDRATHFDKHACDLPKPVIAWAGLRNLGPNGRPIAHDEYDEYGEPIKKGTADPVLGDKQAAQWNDEDKADFAQIAQLVREHVKPID